MFREQDGLFVSSMKVITMRADKNDMTASNTAGSSLPAPATLGALRTAALRLSDVRRKPKLKTRDLVGLLLSHGARAWRCSLPPVKVKLTVTAPSGIPAVRFGYSARPVVS